MRPIKYHPNNPPTIAIIGKAPGTNEMRVGQPFIGPEGQYMNKLLNSAGLNRFECFISYTVQEQPPRNDYHLLRQEQLDFGRKELIEDLTHYRDLGLTTVIAVGVEAMLLLTEKAKIHQYRGTALPCTLVPGLKVYSTIDPGNILRGEGKYEPIFILDVKKAIADSKTAEITYPYRNIQIISTEQEAVFQLSLVTNIDTPVVIDIETAGPKMTAFGWAISPHQAYVLDSKILENPTVLNYLGRFASSSTPKIFHNALFDVFHGAYYYQILYKNIDFDTMIAQHSAYPTLPKSLGFCASIYTNEPYWKEEGKEAMEELKRGILSWDKLYIYNGKDCCLTYEIYIALKQELTDWDVWEVFNERMAMLPACLYAQMRGLLLDKEACEELAQKNEKAIDTLEYIKEQVIGDINIRSSKQLSELIYGQWGMPVHKKGGRVTTEEKKLRMMLRYPTPYSAALGLILELKERYKLRDFYNIKTDEDGRVRCSMKITGTYTGRLATSASITGSGMNLQNIPKSVRIIYKADPGKILCQCDLSQSEARIVAALCGDVEWLKAFDERDLHKEVAAFLYGIPLEKVQKETHRLIAKRVAHGTHYGMGYMLLSEIIECPPKEAKRLREKYIELRNGIKTWHTRVKQQIREKRFIRTPFGVVIQFFGPIGNLYDTDDDAAVGKIMREAVAAEPQSTSVSYINRGIIKCFEVIPEFDFLLQVHDSILFQVADDLETLQRVLPQIKELIEVPLTVNNITFSIPLNFEIGYNWGNMTEMKSLNELETAYKELKK